MGSHFELLNVDSGGSTERSSDDGKSASQPEEKTFEEQPLREAALPVQTMEKSAENFSVQEDNLLVSAWLETSKNAGQNSKQSCTTYWQRIHDYFHVHKDFASDRDVDSLLRRWNVIRESVNRFCGCYSQIQYVWEDFITEEDKVLEACQLYKEKDKHNESFDFLHCWNILQCQEKWNDWNHRSYLQKTTSDSSQGSCTSGSNESYDKEEEEEDDDDDDDEEEEEEEEDEEEYGMMIMMIVMMTMRMIETTTTMMMTMMMKKKNDDDEEEEVDNNNNEEDKEDFSSKPASARQHYKEEDTEGLKENKRKACHDEKIALKKKRLELVAPQQKSPELIAMERKWLELEALQNKML